MSKWFDSLRGNKKSKRHKAGTFISETSSYVYEQTYDSNGDEVKTVFTSKPGRLPFIQRCEVTREYDSEHRLIHWKDTWGWEQWIKWEGNKVLEFKTERNGVSQ